MFPNLGSQYQFIKKIGSGGAGVVNLAVDLHSGFLVAIKTLFSNHLNNEEIVQKFQTEANIYLMLDHPNIVKLKNFIIRDKVPHLVQEYVEGQTLDNYIKRVTGPMPTDKCLKIMTSILSAINYAHQKTIPIRGYDGVLHLDIKPGNVLIGKTGEIKIIDYGISQGNSQERGKKIQGSPMYMAPEQLDISKNLDERTDIYSLGVLLHFILTASQPYTESPTLDSLFKKITHDPLVRSHDLYPGVDKRFQKIIDKATKKEPFERYQSCYEFISALEELKLDYANY